MYYFEEVSSPAARRANPIVLRAQSMKGAQRATVRRQTFQNTLLYLRDQNGAVLAVKAPGEKWEVIGDFLR